MKKTLKNTNLLFAIMTVAVMLLHIYFLFAYPTHDDESQYLSIPFRLINGDSLVQEEWHLTQFSSLFTYIPVQIWMAIKGSADGIFLFSRCVYLAIHTAVSTLIYHFFKEYGNRAVLASLIFFIQMPYGIQAISYHSMFAIFLLLLTLCLLSIYKNKDKKSYILAGVCYGCCCVCNPFFCLAFVLYLICCGLWTKRDAIKEYIIQKKTLKANKGKKLTNRELKEQKKQTVSVFPEAENYNCFFTKDAVLKIICGIAIIGVVAVIYFFFTGGTIGSIFDNVENLLGGSEYIAESSVFLKIAEAIKYFSIANLYMPWILPLLFIIMLFDKKRKSNSHRTTYLAVSLLWMVIFIAGVVIKREVYLCAFSLPFSVFSLVCYILTEKKNKPLFFCMYLPCLIASFFHFIAADTLLAAAGIILAISNVAGVLFSMDLRKEMRDATTEETEESGQKSKKSLQNVIAVALCVQIVFYCAFYQWGQFYSFNTPKAEEGPYAGLYMTESKYEAYNKAINDLNVIREISNENDPVMIASFRIWMYLHLDRPIGTYTSWYRGGFDVNQLTAYYKANPHRIPKYIYIESPGIDEDAIRYKLNILSDMFSFTRQDLSNGVLLTVKKCYI